MWLNSAYAGEVYLDLKAFTAGSIECLASGQSYCPIWVVFILNTIIERYYNFKHTNIGVSPVLIAKPAH